MKVKRFMEAWVKQAMVTDTGTFRYQASYQIPAMEISQYNDNNQETYRVTLYDVYPKIINDISLSSASKEFSRCQVQFVYRRWESQVITANHSSIDSTAKKIASSILHL